MSTQDNRDARDQKGESTQATESQDESWDGVEVEGGGIRSGVWTPSLPNRPPIAYVESPQHTQAAPSGAETVQGPAVGSFDLSVHLGDTSAPTLDPKAAAQTIQLNRTRLQAQAQADAVHADAMKQTVREPMRDPSEGTEEGTDVETIDFEDLPEQASPESETLALTHNNPSVRRYSDGNVTNQFGRVLHSGEFIKSRVIRVPYASDTVLGRFGEYDLIRELGRGGMGVVYLAYAVRLGRTCAMKVMSPSDTYQEADIIRFQNEAVLAARLNHPNIVKVFDSGEAEGKFYFVMECIEGRAFDDLIQSGTPEDVKIGVAALAKVARALHFAHNRGVVHRDIKPDNILLDENDQPFITDFGIAKNLLDREAQLTTAGMALGTPFYMPPEQAAGEIQNIGPASDTYALGATLYHLITGSVPFDGDNIFTIMLRVTGEEPEAPSSRSQSVRGRGVDLDLETICLKAIEKDAHRRYESMEAFAEDLEAYLSGHPIKARPITNTEKFQKLLRRNRAAFVASAVVASVLLLMTVAFGAVVGFNIHRSGQSLRALDRDAALNQASTLERAIRVNMLQGRADSARDLVSKLREDQQLNQIAVVRPDGVYAYTDTATLEAVEKRLSDPEVMASIREKKPEMLPRIEEAKRTAIANIRSNARAAETYDYDPKVWEQVLYNEGVGTKIEEGPDGKRSLVVMKPIANSEACQTCHGEHNAGYAKGNGKNRIRAILVIHRSLDEVEDRIRSNQIATLLVGLATTFVFIILLWIFSKVFGIRVTPQEFGKKEGSSPPVV